MNIAIFTDTYSPQINGVVEVIRTLRIGLEKKGHRVFIIAPKISLAVETESRVYRIPSLPLPGMLSEHRISLFYSKTINKKFMIKNKIDIIHSQTPSSIGILGMILGKQAKIPHIHHYQTFFEDYAHYFKVPSSIMRYSIRQISKWFCNQMDLITVPTYPFKSVLENYGVHKEIKLWTSGIDTRRFRTGTNMRSELGISESNFVLLFVGRVAKEKNIDFLIELMPDLIKKHKKIRLLIVGDGPQRKELESYSKKLGVSDVVNFTGYIPRERIMDVYHSSDVFVFSSLTETQGLVVLEAMASGRPVVAVPAYGIKYILKDGQGAFLSELNKHEFISRINMLLDPVQYKKMSEKALRFVHKFSYEKSTAVILSIYKSLIRQKKRL